MPGPPATSSLPVSFYSYQVFMEGALLSGARAADEALRSFEH
jgi:hypothetical protein